MGATATALAVGGLAVGAVGGAAMSKSKSTSDTEYTETPLATTQREWLEYQIDNYKNVFFPHIKEGLENSTNINSPYNVAQMQKNARAAQEAYASANRATSQSLKQQGLAGKKSGVENLMRGYNERSKASSLASSYYSQLLNMENEKKQYLQMGLASTPGTTSATPMNSSTTQTHKPSFGEALGQVGSAAEGMGKLLAAL